MTDGKTPAPVANNGKTQAPAALLPADIKAFRLTLQKLPAKKRIDAILSRKDVLKVVRALPPLDLFATMREVGVEDCLEVLELCSPAQVQAFLDLDGWRGDRIDSSAISQWLRALFAANGDRAVGQLRGLDLELLTLLLKVHSKVYDLAAEEDPEGDLGLHSITPDRHYLIAFGGVVNDEMMQHVLKEAVDRLMGRDVMFVIRLCEAIRWELPSALEESAFHWRNNRMADLGFLPRHEALEVFAHINPDGDFPSVRPQLPPPLPAENEVVTDLSKSVIFPWEILDDSAAVMRIALSGVPEHTAEQVLHELMLVANRVHCADGGDFGDPLALATVARQVAETVGCAIAYRARGEPERFADIVNAIPVLALFRIGNALLLRLKTELSRVVHAKDSGFAEDGLLRLDSPLREVAAGLLRPRPLMYAGLVDKKRTDYKAPASLNDLLFLTKAVAEIAFRGAVFSSRVLALPPVVGDEPPLSHAALLGTALAHALLGNSATAQPIAAADLAQVRTAIADEANRTRAVQTLCALAAEHAPLPGCKTAPEAHQRMFALASQVMGELHQELSHIRGDVDPRFVSLQTHR